MPTSDIGFVSDFIYIAFSSFYYRTEIIHNTGGKQMKSILILFTGLILLGLVTIIAVSFMDIEPNSETVTYNISSQILP
jgi:hypothetical protein